MGRKALGDTAMTAAQRKARSRSMRQGEIAGLADMVMDALARFGGIAERSVQGTELAAQYLADTDAAMAMCQQIKALAEKA